jgi:hypothetical protein
MLGFVPGAPVLRVAPQLDWLEMADGGRDA